MKFGRVCVAVGVGFWVAASMAGPVGAQQQKAQISDKTVVTLMDYAWALTPEEYTTESSKIIRINKNKFEEVKLPLDDAREVIRVARISGQAQLCELIEAQSANYEALMTRELARAKWTDQQLVFINKLHLFTVMTITGQVEAADSAKVMPKEGPPKKAVNCSEADRKRVGDEIAAYVTATNAASAAKAGPSEKKK